MSDKQLRQDILDIFQWDPRVEPAAIEVKVEKGVVTLTGTVGTDDERMAAEEDVGHVAGVNQLRQRIEVADGLAGQAWHGTMAFMSPTD